MGYGSQCWNDDVTPSGSVRLARLLCIAGGGGRGGEPLPLGARAAARRARGRSGSTSGAAGGGCQGRGRASWSASPGRSWLLLTGLRTRRQPPWHERGRAGGPIVEANPPALIEAGAGTPRFPVGCQRVGVGVPHSPVRISRSIARTDGSAQPRNAPLSHRSRNSGPVSPRCSHALSSTNALNRIKANARLRPARACAGGLRTDNAAPPTPRGSAADAVSTSGTASAALGLHRPRRQQRATRNGECSRRRLRPGLDVTMPNGGRPHPWASRRVAAVSARPRGAVLRRWRSSAARAALPPQAP